MGIKPPRGGTTSNSLMVNEFSQFLILEGRLQEGEDVSKKMLVGVAVLLIALAVTYVSVIVWALFSSSSIPTVLKHFWSFF